MAVCDAVWTAALCRFVGLWRTQLLDVELTGRPKPAFGALGLGGNSAVTTQRLARFLVGDPGGARTEMTLPYDARCGAQHVRVATWPSGWSAAWPELASSPGPYDAPLLAAVLWQSRAASCSAFAYQGGCAWFICTLALYTRMWSSYLFTGLS